jgi:hypothetical protein
MILRLFHEKMLEKDVESVASAIENCFDPYGLVVQRSGLLAVPDDAAVQGMLNAAILLKRIRHISGIDLSLWLVGQVVFFPNAGPIFGCAAGRNAVLSKAGLDPETFRKEALHEVGHLMGLGHCTEKCVMSASGTATKARDKPASLCPKCRARLEIITYMR